MCMLEYWLVAATRFISIVGASLLARRNQRMTLCIIPLAVAVEWSNAQDSDLNRQSVAQAIAAGEQMRASYRVVFEQYAEGKRPPADQRITYERLTDGATRGRRIRKDPASDEYGNVLVSVWSDSGSLALKKFDLDPNRSQSLSIDNSPPDRLPFDQVELSLGLRFEVSLSRPSDLIADSKENVIVRHAGDEAPGCVEVVFIAPSFSKQMVITHVYDPNRQWALLDSRLVYSEDELSSEEVSADRQTLNAHHVMSEWRQSNGVWVPMRVRNDVMMFAGTENEQHGADITEVQQFEISPAVSDSDFVIPTDHLPDDSMISDSGLGISYKLGQSLLYMDGRLHTLKQPISGIITAAELPSIMEGAVAVVSDAPPLKPLASSVPWWRSAGYALVAGGVALLAGVYWMRRRAAG